MFQNMKMIEEKYSMSLLQNGFLNKKLNIKIKYWFSSRRKNYDVMFKKIIDITKARTTIEIPLI